MSDQIQVSDDDGILQLCFNRPEKLNAISDTMLEDIRQALDRFGQERRLRVMLIRSRGKYFSSGVEVTSDISPEVGGSTLEGRRWYRKKYHLLFDEIEAVEKPVVVAHHGPCLGGALEMSLSCDFRLAARSATYALPEIDIGALPGSGGVSRLTRIAGPHWARWLVMAGESISADEALRIGIVHRVYDDAALEEGALTFCKKLIKQPYEVMGLAKLSIELAADLDRAQGRNVERISNSILFTGAEHKALVQAFLDRQAAKRKDRKP